MVVLKEKQCGIYVWYGMLDRQVHLAEWGNSPYTYVRLVEEHSRNTRTIIFESESENRERHKNMRFIIF